MGNKKNKRRRQSRQKLREHKSFIHFCTKLHERLTIILDYNIQVKNDPCEQDIILLEELYRMYDTSTLNFADMYDKEAESVKQLSIHEEKVS